MKRLLAVLALVCVVLVLPCILSASYPTLGKATTAFSERVEDSLPSDDNDKDQPGSANGTEGDPDELGGGFRRHDGQPSGQQSMDATPDRILDSLVLFFMSLL